MFPAFCCLQYHVLVRKCGHMLESVYDTGSHHTIHVVDHIKMVDNTFIKCAPRGGRMRSRDSDNCLRFQGQEVWMQAKPTAQWTKSQGA